MLTFKIYCKKRAKRSGGGGDTLRERRYTGVRCVLGAVDLCYAPSELVCYNVWAW